MRFTKHDSNKSRLDLLPPDALDFVGRVLGFGADLYAAENWRKCRNPQRYIGPILRHTLQHQGGQFTDSESGLPHLAHAACSALFALDLYLKLGQGSYGKNMDERFNYFALVEKTGKKKGIVKKRFRTFTKAWDCLMNGNLGPDKLKKYIVKTVLLAEKVGCIVSL